MKSVFKIGNIVLGLIIVVILSSCLKDYETNFEVNADAYVIKRVVEGSPRYATAFYTFANKTTSSVTVTKPDNSTVSLVASPENLFSFMHEPAKNEFTSNLPVFGDYQFEILSVDDDLAQTSDFLDYANLPVPEVYTEEYDSVNQLLELSWDAIPEADGFAVKLSKSDGEIIFISFSLDWEAVDYQISASTGSWTESASIGTNYILEVHAFLLESNADTEDLIYNLKEISIGEKEIVWGE